MFYFHLENNDGFHKVPEAVAQKEAASWRKIPRFHGENKDFDTENIDLYGEKTCFPQKKKTINRVWKGVRGEVFSRRGSWLGSLHLLPCLYLKKG